MIWKCPNCGYKTNSERIKRIHQKTKHECLQRQKMQKENKLNINDFTKAEIIKMLEKKNIEYNARELKADLFAKLGD